MAVAQQSVIAQHLEVERQPRPGRAQLLGEFAHAALAARQGLEHLQPAGSARTSSIGRQVFRALGDRPGIRLVLECTGTIETPETLAAHCHEPGIARVIVACPVRGDLDGVEILPCHRIDRLGVFALGSMGGGLRLQSFLGLRQPSRAVFVGGGCIGLEMVEALAARSIAVTLLEQNNSMLTTIHPSLAGVVEQDLRRQPRHPGCSDPSPRRCPSDSMCSPPPSSTA